MTLFEIGNNRMAIHTVIASHNHGVMILPLQNASRLTLSCCRFTAHDTGLAARKKGLKN